MRSIVIISELPLHREALKSIARELTLLKILVYPELTRAVRRAIRFAPVLIIIDNPHIRFTELEPFFEHTHRDIKIVTIDWDQGKMMIYSRTGLLEATLQSLTEIVKLTQRNDAQEASDESQLLSSK